MPEAIVKHPYVVKDVGAEEKGEWHFILRSNEDEGRRILVHVFLFDLFVVTAQKG